jgi:hypothetical protein
MLFLHTPMTVIEQHKHSVETFLSKNADLPYGIDAAIYEGWLLAAVRSNLHFAWIKTGRISWQSRERKSW